MVVCGLKWIKVRNVCSMLLQNEHSPRLLGPLLPGTVRTALSTHHPFQHVHMFEIIPCRCIFPHYPPCLSDPSPEQSFQNELPSVSGRPTIIQLQTLLIPKPPWISYCHKPGAHSESSVRQTTAFGRGFIMPYRPQVHKPLESKGINETWPQLYK